MVNPNRFELQPRDLRWRCDPASLPFSCTDEIEPPATFIGQDRAVAALAFGLGVQRPSYNIFVTGLTGTGKNTVIRSHLAEAVRQRTKGDGDIPLYDWCYVYNFDSPDRPRALRLPRGTGARLTNQCRQLLDTLRRDIRAAFDDETYKAETRRMLDELVARRQELIKHTEADAIAHGFAVQISSAGIAVIPVVNGKPLEQSTYLSMSDDQRSGLDQARREVTASVEEAVTQIRELERAHTQRVEDLDRRVAENTIERHFTPLREQYQDLQQALTFVEGLRAHTIEHARLFRQDEESEDAQQTVSPHTGRVARNPFLPYQVNLFVDNSSKDAPPIVVEHHPTYMNLFGQIERRPLMGTYVTDHTMLKPGALALANGGYLVVEAREILLNPGVWPALKRVLRGQQVRPEDPSEMFMSAIFPPGLRPEPIPIDVKVIMTGDPELYHLLSAVDEDFWQIFKVRADLDHQMPNTPAHVSDYGAFVCGVVKEQNLRPFTNDAVAAVAEYGARLVSDRKKLSTRFGQLADVLVEATHWAELDGAPRVQAKHVLKALEEKVYRSSRIADTIREAMVDGTLMVDLEGAEIGQVNGLAVYTVGDFSFGKPSRITARTYMGREGIINIEREARLSGQTHDKGVLILSGYLGWKFAQDHPLSVTVTIAFEQSYGLVEGDSASSTELYAILSSLSRLPINQAIAVTGSVNQLGEIQPIGGANEKVEGYFELCKAAGRLGNAGILLPKNNVRNLMLRQEILDAVHNRQFHVYAVETVDDGISILTGVEAG
ncbi:MAG: AAA family ATPase, partial [Gemmatimonadetes bacterium]|nr:AAA family ATPase [Gemmatimonadota bacterium]